MLPTDADCQIFSILKKQFKSRRFHIDLRCFVRKLDKYWRGLQWAVYGARCLDTLGCVGRSRAERGTQGYVVANARRQQHVPQLFPSPSDGASAGDSNCPSCFLLRLPPPPFSCMEREKRREGCLHAAPRVHGQGSARAQPGLRLCATGVPDQRAGRDSFSYLFLLFSPTRNWGDARAMARRWQVADRK